MKRAFYFLRAILCEFIGKPRRHKREFGFLDVPYNQRLLGSSNAIHGERE